MSKDVEATVTTAIDWAGALGTLYRDTAVRMLQRRLTTRNLLPTINVTVGSVDYASQTTRTNRAAGVAEGTVKPESAYG